ncbi:MAG TPA: enoyl-CoA hydratase-related protein, partial [Casimicrobiaceae bacterium]|nr:enoyl-CoA hydratase-related protein [Casimicrobiaceae bacterium]
TTQHAAAGGPTEAGGASLVYRGPVAEIGLANGPLNLVTRALLRQLERAIAEVAARTDVRCLILHGGDARAFCAGSDIREFAQLRDDASEHKILFEDMVLRNLARVPMPSIAAIDGPALGGGLELALACDLRVLRRGVPLGLTESRLGGLAGNGSVRLARLVGPARAKELLFTGETIADGQALAWGIVNRVVDGSALDGARALAATIAGRGPVSNRLAKQLVDAAQDGPIDAALASSTVAQQRIFSSDDLHEGVAAFFAKRPPRFEGR